MAPGRRDIQIHFIRRKADGSADTDTTHDDLLRITRLSDNSNRIIYIERGDESATIDILLCSNYQLLGYLYRLFWLTTLDEDPFHSIKFYIPGFPVFQLQATNVQANIPNILDIILSLCWNWPTVGYAPMTPERRSSHSLLVREPQQTTNSCANNNCTNCG